MFDGIPSAVTPDERNLVAGLSSAPEYLQALLRSAWRQERLLTEIRDELRARPTAPPRGRAGS